MKISFQWLNELIDISDFRKNPQELAGRLTSAGLEVESVVDRSAAFAHVVVGHILEKGQHPNADRLSLCQVSTGTGVVHQIVCGAQNHKQDDRVVVALPGAILPGNFEIKQSKIRGVNSGGMLCSEKELGLKVESEGIMILPNDAPIGASFADYMGLDDVLFELKITPNRADCLSHLGLARELSALLDRPLRAEALQKYQASALQLSGNPSGAAAGPAVGAGGGDKPEAWRLEVRDHESCPQYHGLIIRGVRIAPSSSEVKRRLEALGLKSINNVVDITNLVMMELGQPLHAFDLAQIEGQVIIVDRAQENEKFTTLDAVERRLSGEDLTIRDNEKILALAGVMGGASSAIQDTTTDILLESALFAPMRVRRTARRHGLDTDASHRFSRGINPEGVETALHRAAQMIIQAAGGSVDSATVLSAAVAAAARPPIRLSLRLLEESIGEKMGADAVERVQSIFKRLGCEINTIKDNINYNANANSNDNIASIEWMVTPPATRQDLQIDMDLVEEYARIHGYDKIPEALPAYGQSPTPHSDAYLLEQNVRRLLASAGMHQAIHRVFVPSVEEEGFWGLSENLKNYGIDMRSQPIRLRNPLSEEENSLRRGLSLPLLKTVAHHVHRGVLQGSLFEVGSVFDDNVQSKNAFQREGAVGGAEGAGAIDAASAMGVNAFTERTHIALVMWKEKGSSDSFGSSGGSSGSGNATGSGSGSGSSSGQEKWESLPVFQLKSRVENFIKTWTGQSDSKTKLAHLRIQKPNVQSFKHLDFLHPGQWATVELDGQNIGFLGTLHPQWMEKWKLRPTLSVAVCEFVWDCAKWGNSPQWSKIQPISPHPFVERDITWVLPPQFQAGEIIPAVFRAAGERSMAHLLQKVSIIDVFAGAGGLEPGQRAVTYRLIFQDQSRSLEDSEINRLRDQLVEDIQKQFPVQQR